MTEIRGLTRRWKPPADMPASGGLLERVLASRGLAGPAGADFLDPSLKGLHDPSLMPGLDRAAERLLAGALDGERIVIYGDYDVDGITATAILYHTLKTIAPRAEVSSYVPHRLDEGYGLNAEALLKLKDAGAGLVVSVDCGVTASAPARAAASAGLDLIITDHHTPPATEAELPPCYALVHPRCPGSRYPFGDLCGAGVAYKLAWRLCTLRSGSARVDPSHRTLLIDLLGLAALGSIADVVPLVDENRVIARFGLPQLARSPLAGLRALIEASGLDRGAIDAEKVGFQLAPRLNAIGRLGHAADAVELLTTASGARARSIATDLCAQNDRRRATERTIFERACRLAEDAAMTGPDRRAIVLAHEDWHPGVVGIVCSRLVERYARPAILMQRQDDLCAGSGRSVDAFNLHAGLEACSEHLVRFGGHDMAAGLALETGRLDAFTEAFLAHAGERIAPAQLVHTVRYDADARPQELTPGAVRQIARLAPFGRGNPSVRLRLRDVRVAGRARPFGKAGQHLSFNLVPTGSGSGGLRAIAWRWAERLESIPHNAPIEAIVCPKVSGYNGAVEPEIIDLRLVGAGVAPEPAIA